MVTSPSPAYGSDAWVERFASTLEAERQRAHEFLAAQLARLERTETVVEDQIGRLERELRGHCDESMRLHEERDALMARLTEAETRLQEAEEHLAEIPADHESESVPESGDRRYQMALDDIRQLRAANNELREQLAKAKAAAANVGRQPRVAGSLDWESEKKRILAALEASADEEDEARRDERQEIAEVVRTTSRVVADKDSEIQELRQRLEESAGSAGKAETAFSVPSVVETDAIIREERGRLQQLQEEWREKLRQAEVEIALERAKIARQRAEMEQRNHPATDADMKSSEAAETTSQAEQSARGRWLARLGLTDADLVPGRHL